MKHNSREAIHDPGTIIRSSIEVPSYPGTASRDAGKSANQPRPLKQTPGTPMKQTPGTVRHQSRRMRLNPWKVSLAVVCLGVAIYLVVSLILFAANRIIYGDINPSITIEAGTPIPAADAFVKNPDGTVAYITDVSKIDTGRPGVSPVEIKYDNKSYNVKLVIKDTTAPDGVIKELDLVDGETATVQDFIESIKDAQAVTASYKEAPDFTKINSQPVTIILQDPSGNKAEYPTTLRISKTKKSITVEATPGELNIKDLLKSANETGTAAFAGDPPKLNHVGEFPVQISIGGVIYDSVVKVVDTVAPVGSAVSQDVWVGSDIVASSFAKDIKDMTSVIVSFKAQPDLTLIGKQSVAIVLTDEGGNQTILQSSLSIKKDTTPPKLYTSNRVTVYIDQAVAYKKGVVAEDEKDGKVDVTVDSSGVNPKVEGEYTVVYSATDSSGNTSTASVPVTVKKQTVTMEALEKLGDEVLAQIITPAMTMREKAWAIYQYVNLHVNYNGYSDKTDWMKEAYNGITKGVGDCFTYYSVSNLLLTRAGFEILSVQRASNPGEAKHYWHMVYCDGGWYHFDACIHKPKLVSFMLTDAQLDAYSALQGKGGYYYRYDRSKYPATPLK